MAKDHRHLFSGQDKLFVLKSPGLCVKGNFISMPISVLLCLGAEEGATKSWFSLSDVDLGVVLSSFTFQIQATEKAMGFRFVWAMSKK